MYTIGWDRLLVSTPTTQASLFPSVPNSDLLSDGVKAYAAGLAEGYLSASVIQTFLLNSQLYFLGDTNGTIPNPYPESYKKFVDNQDAWINMNIQTEAANGDVYWRQVNLTMYVCFVGVIF